MSATPPTPAATSYVGHKLPGGELLLLAQDNADAAAAVSKLRSATVSLGNFSLTLTTGEFQALKRALAGEDALLLNCP